ncbi:MAG: DUF4249 family protein [Salinivirgaceae bacterium]|nr:DUF4249 family protein [Salinivirgaceae bacterium]
MNNIINNKMRNVFLCFFIIIFFNSCIEEFFFENNSENEIVYVVDGQILTNNVEQFIKVSTAVSLGHPIFNPVSNCLVSVYDENGNVFHFEETANYSKGVYVGEIPIEFMYFGNKFKMTLETKDGKILESDFEELLQGVPLDSLDYVLNTNSNGMNKANFYLNMPVDDNYDSYYRFEINESWEYHAAFPIIKYYAYVDNNIEFFDQFEDYSKNICYKSQDLKCIYSASFDDVVGAEYLTVPLHFVSNETQRFKYKYSVLATQYSLTKKAYDFWGKLKNTSQNGETVFGNIPMNADGNISCKNNPDEIVLGYFGVSDYATKRFLVDLPEDFGFYESQFDCSINEVDGKVLLNILANLEKEDGPYYLPQAPAYDPGGTYIADQGCFDCRKKGGQTQIFDFWKEK